jgi:hypothetical protein
MGGDAPVKTAPRSLIGRDDHLEGITAFVGQAAVSGGALLLSGDAGVGKTVLLDAAAAHAEAAGSRVLRAAGAKFEGAVSFAGLNQVLHPLLGGVRGLSVAYCRALSVALGVRAGSPPDQLMVSNAVLALLVRATATRPLLVMVDDLPWLDRASAVVLGVVARRLAGSRIGFLAVSRSGEDGFFDRGGLPEHEVGPLGDAAAAKLVSDRFPSLAPRVRQRLLAEAQGNPLALLELPVALSGMQRAGAGPLPAWLPLSRRLQEVFESRITVLPARTRQLLLLAVLDGTGSLPTLQSAAPGPHGIDDLAPAERARLVQVDEGASRLTFRHPLTRSAVVAMSTSAQRREAHQALARHLTDQPERGAWHLAQASVGPDEQVAGLLEQAAHRIRHRGDAVGAVAALLRAADLTPPGADRSRRLAEAAYLGAVVTGGPRDVPRLLDDARKAGAERAGSLVAAVAAAHHLLLSGDGDIDTAHRLLVGAVPAIPQAGHHLPRRTSRRAGRATRRAVATQIPGLSRPHRRPPRVAGITRPSCRKPENRRAMQAQGPQRRRSTSAATGATSWQRCRRASGPGPASCTRKYPNRFRRAQRGAHHRRADLHPRRGLTGVAPTLAPRCG